MYSGVTNWLNRSSSRQSVEPNSVFSLSSKINVGTSTPGFGVFLLVVCTASGSNLSVACGLLLEVYILPRPPRLKLESVRGWRTEVNETAPRRGECAGETCLCVCACACVSVRVTVSEEGGGMEFESEEKGRGLCRETEANDYEHQTTQISTQSQRYRKEDQRNRRACMKGMKKRDCLHLKMNIKYEVFSV